ncbi:MAG: ABC transporter substrate-binding protein [Balneolaceae bacterium]|nr:MAG: ABC transporter substrate-binding protein [Balneolaceae bacterium]
MKFILSVTYLSVILLLNALNAQPAANEIRSMLEERDLEIKELLGPEGSDYTQQQRDQLKDIINDVIDYRSMAAFALGNTYTEISKEEQDEFVSLFATIIRDNSLNRLDIYRAEVEYLNIIVDGNEAVVETMAQLDNVRTQVDYNLRRDAGTWVITDMTIDEVSTAESYNRQFQSIIRQRGFDALMQSLQRRAARANR